MSETVQIILIVAAAVLVVLFLFRNQLKDFIFKAGPQGLETHLSTREPQPGAEQAAPSPGQRPSVVVRGNVQSGQDHEIRVRRSDVEVSDNLQEGARDEIDVA